MYISLINWVPCCIQHNTPIRYLSPRNQEGSQEQCIFRKVYIVTILTIEFDCL